MGVAESAFLKVSCSGRGGGGRAPEIQSDAPPHLRHGQPQLQSERSSWGACFSLFSGRDGRDAMLPRGSFRSRPSEIPGFEEPPFPPLQFYFWNGHPRPEMMGEILPSSLSLPASSASGRRQERLGGGNLPGRDPILPLSGTLQNSTSRISAAPHWTAG